jgi:acyl carrier protein
VAGYGGTAEQWGRTMSIESISVIEQTSVMKDDIASGKIRALIAKHLGVEIERITDEAHFANDLGADWLDRVELVIAIEDQFAGVEITDDDVDQINVVADLIRCIERPDSERAGALAADRNAPPVHRFFGPRPRAEWNSLLNKSAAAK